MVCKSGKRYAPLVTAEDAAKWMLEQLERKRCLYQEAAASEIAKQFGDHFTYTNDNGNRAIHKDVLNAFRKLTKDSVVWNREDRFWRKREQGDAPGRQQG